MDIEKSCICVFTGPKQFLTQGASTRSYHLSTLDVNQCHDSHLSSDIGRRHIAKGWEKAGIAQLLDESFSLPPEDPFEETEGSVEIS